MENNVENFDSLFAESSEGQKEEKVIGYWKVLLVDDKKDAHEAMIASLNNFRFKGKSLKFFSAFSGEESIEVLKNNPDIALIYMDAIMSPVRHGEPPDGLQAVNVIRNEIRNKIVRIIMRTGYPGDVPAKEVITNFDINGYLLKEASEGADLQLYIATVNALRNYEYILDRENYIDSLSRLTGSVAHEINNPIGNIRHSASIIERYEAEFVKRFGGNIENKDMERYFANIFKLIKMISIDSQRAYEIIAQFKELSEAARRETVKMRFNLKMRLEEDLLCLMNRFKDKRHKVILNCPDTEIESYPGVLSQIFNNLVANAIIHGYEYDTTSASPSKGVTPPLSLLTKRENGVITVDAILKDRELKLIVKDDGKGISPTDQEKIFEPFYTTRQVKGSTGLGLNVVFNLVKQKLKGDIVCESVMNEGAKFTVTLPI